MKFLLQNCKHFVNFCGRLFDRPQIGKILLFRFGIVSDLYGVFEECFIIDEILLFKNRGRENQKVAPFKHLFYLSLYGLFFCLRHGNCPYALLSVLDGHYLRCRAFYCSCHGFYLPFFLSLTAILYALSVFVLD